MKKKYLTPEEGYGLTKAEISKAEKYLKANHVENIIKGDLSNKYLEMFISGYSFDQLFEKFPHEDQGRLLLTAAREQWVKRKENIQASTMGRIKSNVVMAVQESSELIATILKISNDNLSKQVKKYMEDPVNNEPPLLTIKSVADIQKPVQMLESLLKSVSMFSNTVKAEQAEDSERRLVMEKEAIIKTKALRRKDFKGRVSVEELEGRNQNLKEIESAAILAELAEGGEEE
jgi:hypothetical protein